MNTGKLIVSLQVDPPGILETIARPDPSIVIHCGAPVQIGCERGGTAHFGISVHGNIDIIPGGTASQWTLKKRDCALVVRLSRDLLSEAASALAVDASEAVLLNRFQVRDAKLEHLAWALKTEMDDGFRGGSLLADSIGLAMAFQLLLQHSLATGKRAVRTSGVMPTFRMRKVLAYIDDHLCGDLSLGAIAVVSGLSVSHCQRSFRNTVGLSIHQYVIRRRVDRAKSLLLKKKMSIIDASSAVGFSHQSHLAFHMHRILGMSPATVRKAGE